jgi:pyruvate, water dikinase
LGTDLSLGDGVDVTVSCAEGDVGFVYSFRLSFDIFKTVLKDLSVIRTDLMLNVASPTLALHA